MDILIFKTILFFSILIGFIGAANSFIDSTLAKKDKKDTKQTKSIIFLETLRIALGVEIPGDLLFIAFTFIITLPILPLISGVAVWAFLIILPVYLFGIFLAFHFFIKPFMIQKKIKKRGLKISFWYIALSLIISFSILSLILLLILVL